MRFGKLASLAMIFIPILLGLQGCFNPTVNTSVVKQKPTSTLFSLSDAESSKLFQRGVFDYLSNISQGFNSNTKKPIPVSQIPLLREVILSTGRGKQLTGCQFPALRIELDGKKDTADWLVTTKGKGARCSTKAHFFWIIQQSKSRPPKILLASRGSFVKIGKIKSAGWSEVEIENSAMISIKNGDKLADGSWVQVPSRDNSRVQIDCRNKLRLQGERYQSYAESAEANVVSLPFPGKSWQPVKNPRYRCSF